MSHNLKYKADSCTYCGDVYTEENVTQTQAYVNTRLLAIRAKHSVKQDEDFLLMSQTIFPQKSYRHNINGESYMRDIMCFSIDSPYDDHNPTQIIWTVNQYDGYSCVGATIFTCTAGYAKIDPRKILQVIDLVHRLQRGGNWTVGAANNSGFITGRGGLLYHEGLLKLVHSTMGTIPCMVCGYVGNDIKDENDNMFQDEKSLLKLLKMARLVSINMFEELHWYSLIVKEKANGKLEFIVRNSMEHEECTKYPNYGSLYDYFLVPLTQKNRWAPVTLAFYPVLQVHSNANMRLQKFMKAAIDMTLDWFDREQTYCVGWKNMKHMLNSI